MKFDIIFEAFSFAKKHKKMNILFSFIRRRDMSEMIAWKCIKSTCNIIKSDLHRDEMNKISR